MKSDANDAAHSTILIRTKEMENESEKSKTRYLEAEDNNNYKM